ncbi:dTDP-4-dehydrorhamnose reductase [Alkalihalobacillus deserti]|uniref:dTDP-4-dehydrorhamnose reductase n=1 Tax=Alkalihalobacillus deserti TaxID=2879466 RepID=UPI001D14629A|nr:dTDP-4-dehydrorhamnose reductase [Alkalihalobacillus deserti]
MKHLLITGAAGQLGKEITKQAKDDFKVTSLGRVELNITNSSLVKETIKFLKPDCIIHAAAYTAVDQCEIEKKKAFEVNALGASCVANAANLIGAKLIYISSDFVFDGSKNEPYQIGDEPNPLSTYGLSKWLGEKLVNKNTENCTIVRTSWLYGHYGNNFVKTMLRLAKKGQPINVVNDQIGSPTYVNDLVDYLLKLIDKPDGTYHVSNAGYCSWYNFAKKIFNYAGYDSNLIRPTTTEKFGSKALRPSYSVMSHQQLQNVGLEIPRAWDIALENFLREELTSD